MPLAIITTQNYAGNGTQAGLLNAVSTGMQTAGFTEIDSFSAGGNQSRVWQYNENPSATYGKLIIELVFTAASTLRLAGYSSWDAVAHTGTDSSTSAFPISNAVNLSNNFVFWICNHPQCRGLIFNEGTTNKTFVGYLRPTIRSWWNEDSFPFAFIPRTFGTWSTSNLQPISNLRPVGLNNQITFGGADNNLTFNEYDDNKGVISEGIISTSNKLIGVFSTDIAAAPTVGMDVLQKHIRPTPSGNEIYTFFDGGNSTTQSRLTIRTE